MKLITLAKIPQTTISILELIESHLFISNLVPATREDFILSAAYNETGASQFGYFFTEKKRLPDTLFIWVTKRKDETFVSFTLNQEDKQLFKRA